MVYEKLVSTALEAGATKADVVDGESVVVNAAFRDICKSNQCGNYGRNWACPGDTSDIQERMEEVKSYSHCLVYQIIAPLEDSFDIEGMMEAGQVISDVSHTLEEKLPSVLESAYLHLCGSCRLCEKCARIKGEPCRNPDKLIKSISGYGIDVNATVKSSTLKYINGQNTVTNFGMVFFNEL